MDTPNPNPFSQFADWFEKASQADIDKPNAMVLSTSDADGRVSARVVLLSSFDEKGFVFHSNYDSEKGKQVETNDQVSLLFWWDDLGYQLRIDGRIEKTSAESSDEYFSQRPRGSQVGAWASQQSSVIKNRAVLDQRVKEFSEKYEGQSVPRPPHWGGYIIIPTRFEFWLNRDDRLHDRFLYELADNEWQWSRLAP